MALHVGVKSRSEVGATLVEFALVAPLFLVLFVSVFAVSVLAFNWTGLQYSAHRSARWASLGKQLNDTDGVPLSRVASIRQYFLNESRAIGIALKPEQIRICTSAPLENCASEDAGESGSAFAVSAIQEFSLLGISSVNNIKLLVIARGRNESF